MSDPWNFAGEPAAGGSAPGTTTLLDGTTFCIANGVGDLEPGATHGLFVADTRFVSCWRLRVDGVPLAPLSTVAVGPSGASFVSRLRPSELRPDPALLVVRDRYVGEGMSELVTIENLGAEPVSVRVVFDVGADFAHLFEVKEDRLRPRGFHSVEVRGGEMRFTHRYRDRSRELRVALPDDADAGPGEVVFRLDLGARERWQRAFDFLVEVDGVALPGRHHGGHPGASPAAARFSAWRALVPTFSSEDEAFSLALGRAIDDLGALRILDPELDEDAVLAAGAPWYMAMFGRDSLIASQMSLLVDPRLAGATLRALGRRQGTRTDETTEEEPGRILHELRFAIDGGSGPSRAAYYGSIDATPLFVWLLGEAWRFGLPEAEVVALLPVADRCIEWLASFGDRDGDGFVEYARANDHGLVNQGWKDSSNSIAFADGRPANGPIALCEVQAYAYAALRARAELATAFGDEATASRLGAWAERLATAFNDAYWMPEARCFALALDGEKRQVDAVTSNAAHALWAGIASPEHATELESTLVSPGLFSGFGLRTLSAEMAAYNPMSYHNGSVWPHDTAIAVAGLTRYGFREAAAHLAEGLLAATAAFGGRPPELFCGFSRLEFAAPIAYPTACAPQAWSSAALLSLCRSFLGYEADVPAGRLALSPDVPSVLGRLEVHGLGFGGARLELEATRTAALVEGLPEDATLLGAERRR